MSEQHSSRREQHSHRRCSRQHRLLHRFILGFGLIAVGVLFTLDNMGLLYADDYLRLWPLLLVALGVGQLVAASAPSERIGGAIWVVIGGWLLAYELGWVRYGVFDLWPLVLVMIGGSLIFRAMRSGSSSTEDDGTTTHAFAIMSGIVRKSSSPEFRGGSLTAVMGGCELDLTHAMLADGRASIDVLAFWGGVEIRVPPTWRVVSRVWPLMGGFEDKSSPPTSEDAEGELEITGLAIMGSVDVQN